MKTLLLIGGGGHCRSCIDVINATCDYTIVGIIDIAERVGQSLDGIPIVGTDSDLAQWIAKVDECLITIGHIGQTNKRNELHQKIIKLGGVLATIVSPLSYVASNSKVGSGSIVMHHAMINVGAEVQANCIINSKALIEHDTCIGSHCHISTGAIINGGAVVSDNVFIGSGSVVFNNCQIGCNSVIGGGQVVRHNLDDGSQPNDIKS